MQNMTLDGRGGGAVDPVPLNYLHMVMAAAAVMVVVVVVVKIVMAYRQRRWW
jgi:hypothetical protein